MASHKQFAANKANAKRRTGPTSASGKNRSRMNSWKHGLAATTLVIGDEEPKHFECLRTNLFEEFDPRSGMVCELVERMAGLLWRLRRIPRLEAAVVEAHRDPLDELAFTTSERDLPERGVGLALIRDAHPPDVLGKLSHMREV